MKKKIKCAHIRREMRRENESDSKIPQSLSHAEGKVCVVAKRRLEIKRRTRTVAHCADVFRLISPMHACLGLLILTKLTHTNSTPKATIKPETESPFTNNMNARTVAMACWLLRLLCHRRFVVPSINAMYSNLLKEHTPAHDERNCNVENLSSVDGA